MRLGKDVLVITKDQVSGLMSVGFLSQTFLAAIKSDRVLIPMVTWTKDQKRVTIGQDGSLLPPDAASDQSLATLCAYSVFRGEDEMMDQLEVLEHHGTIIVITNLRKVRRFPRHHDR